ncbi:MAG: 6-bladed beta-propeller [Balneolaceae bacterium]|nr:6-bladed beta-propeller [Balneolaceae bacterium]
MSAMGGCNYFFSIYAKRLVVYSLTIRYFTILSIIIAGVLFLQNQGAAQERSVTFEEQLVIGNQNNPPAEYLFGGPRYIRTDSENRIYITTMNNSIRVFSPDGKYLKNIGRRGKGPGEFISISAIAVGKNDELIAYDGRLGRLTWFYNFGDSLKSLNLTHPDWTGSDIVPLPNNQFASVEIQFPWIYEVADIDFVDYKDRLIHLIDGDSWEKTRSLFNVYDHMMFDKEEPVEARFAMGGDYQLAKLNDTTLAITHKISDGSIYLVNTKSGYVREVQGHFAGHDSYEILEWQYRRSYHENRYNMVTASATPNTSTLVYQIKLRSRALLANNKWLLHFVQTAEGNNTTYNIEFIDKDGNYLGYTPIRDDFTTRQDDSPVFVAMHLDNQNQLYYADYSSGVPVIRVTKIVMEE